MSGYITTQGVFSSNLPASGTTGTLTSNYILSDASSQVITDVSQGAIGTGIIVMPFIPKMYADASGTVGVLQQTTVQIIDIDHVFNVDTSVADAKKILKGFKVKDLDASGNGTLYDPSANVSVELIPGASGEFISTLASQIAASTSTSLSNKTLAIWLKEETQVDVTKLLSFDTLANLLEASTLKSFAIDLDASGGAENMWNLIGVDDTESAARRRTLFTQFSEAHVEKYAYVDASGLDTSNERVIIMNFLPFVVGDKFTMVFDVVVGQYTMGSNTAPGSGAFISRAQGDYAAGQTGAYTDAYVLGGQVASNFANNSLTITKPTLRRVAVQLALGKSDGTPGNAFAYTRSGDIQSGYVLTLTS